MTLEFGEQEVKVYQVKIPEKIANNFLSWQLNSDGMITVYWVDPDDSLSQTITEEKEQ